MPIDHVLVYYRQVMMSVINNINIYVLKYLINLKHKSYAGESIEALKYANESFDTWILTFVFGLLASYGLISDGPKVSRKYLFLNFHRFGMN